MYIYFLIFLSIFFNMFILLFDSCVYLCIYFDTFLCSRRSRTPFGGNINPPSIIPLFPVVFSFILRAVL